MSKASAPFWAATLIVLLFGASVRLYKLDSYPIGFNQDQMVLGYDAWSIWQTGRDHHGEALPLFFRTFDDYVSPVANYLTSPFVGLLGLNEFNTRLPIAILGALTVLLVALLGREWFGPGAGIVAALLFAIEPWQVNYNRIAYPANLIPFFTTASLYCFTKAMAGLRARRERSAYGWLAACSVSFALLTATYAIMKLQGPLLLFICVLASLTLLRRHPRAAFGWLILFTLCISPLIVQQILQWDTSQARFAAITATNARDANYGQLPYTIRLYASHFDPRTIFFTGFRNSVRFPPTIGELSWVEIPLLIGFILFNRLRQQSNRLGFNLTLLVVLWLLTYPIADTLTGGFYGTASEVRCVPIMPLPELLAGYDALLIWPRLVQLSTASPMRLWRREPSVMEFSPSFFSSISSIQPNTMRLSYPSMKGLSLCWTSLRRMPDRAIKSGWIVKTSHICTICSLKSIRPANSRSFLSQGLPLIRSIVLAWTTCDLGYRLTIRRNWWVAKINRIVCFGSHVPYLLPIGPSFRCIVTLSGY